MNRKEKYESPWMERTLVELEDGFCTASVVTTGKNKVETTGHELKDITLGTTDDSWNKPAGDDMNGWQ